MTDEALREFVAKTDRSEAWSKRDGVNTDWLKAIRATLYALGFDHDWVYGEAYDAIKSYYYEKYGE